MFTNLAIEQGHHIVINNNVFVLLVCTMVETYRNMVYRFKSLHEIGNPGIKFGYKST